jgi:hypothetical protein
MINLTQRSPRIIANATQAAQRQNFDRRGSFARSSEPGTVLS